MPDVLQLNEPAPDFTLPADNGEPVTLSQFRDRSNVLVFFYPADFTPVCTAEVTAFRDDFHLFRARNITLLGISADAVSRHQKFAADCHAPFRLLSDENIEVAKKYGAKGLLGIRRAYFFVDTSGILLWQHAEVLPIFKLSNTRLLETLDSFLAQPSRTATRPDAAQASLSSGSRPRL